jgi:hypothetical protein
MCSAHCSLVNLYRGRGAVAVGSDAAFWYFSANPDPHQAKRDPQAASLTRSQWLVGQVGQSLQMQ